jgi:hypothetical protein
MRGSFRPGQVPPHECALPRTSRLIQTNVVSSCAAPQKGRDLLRTRWSPHVLSRKVRHIFCVHLARALPKGACGSWRHRGAEDQWAHSKWLIATKGLPEGARTGCSLNALSSFVCSMLLLSLCLYRSSMHSEISRHVQIRRQRAAAYVPAASATAAVKQ